MEHALTITTVIAIMITVLLASRVHYWTQRATKAKATVERLSDELMFVRVGMNDYKDQAAKAEAALARVERVIKTEELQAKTDAIIANKVNIPNAANADTLPPQLRGMSVYLNGEKVPTVFAYNISEGWVETADRNKHQGTITAQFGDRIVDASSFTAGLFAPAARIDPGKIALGRIEPKTISDDEMDQIVSKVCDRGSAMWNDINREIERIVAIALSRAEVSK